MMILPISPKRLLPLLLLLLAPFARAQNAAQQLAFAGLRSVATAGQINAVKTDSSGNLFLLINQGDGVRLLKTDNTAANILAQATLGAKGDIGLALALDPAGNVYITGTSTSTTLTATANAAIPNRTDTSTQSFVAKFDASLNPLFVTFTGGSKIAAAALAATADSVFVTGVTYASNLPVTPNGIQQTPATGSSGNGFVERFSASGSTLVYSTYLTGANGDTTPAALVADASDNAYIAGSTSASGFPTIAALVPAILSNPSGFLTKLSPAGDAITFSTFIPGPGLTSLALDSTASNLLLTGSIALGQFPVDTVGSPLASTQYQVLARISLDGSSVLSSTALAPGTQSFVTSAPAGGAWVEGSLSTPGLPIAPFADTGTFFAEHLTSTFTVDQTARFGGVPTANSSYSSLTAVPTSLAVDATGNAFFAGALQPSASASLLATETFDVPLRNAPTTAFPSTIASAEQTAATCSGSLCPGSAAFLAKLASTNAPALSFAVGELPIITLRNLGSATATALTLTVTGGSAVTSNCPTTLAPGALCNALLSGGTAGTLTATSAQDTQSATFAAYKAPAATIAFFPRELDFGIVPASSATQRTITVTNLGTTSQTFTSAIDSNAKTASPFTEASSDCTLAGAITSKVLAPGGTCHIVLAYTAPAATNAASQADWLIGTHDVLLTAFAQAAGLSASASEIDFGTQFVSGLRLPRFLYLSNSSTANVAHATVALSASSHFTLADACPATLIPASVCRIRIDYLASTASNDSTTLTLGASLSVLLTGQTLPAKTVGGATSNPNLAVTPTSVTFANTVPVTAVSSETQTVAITNTGATAFALSLALTGDFTDVTSCPASLPAGATCGVVLTFVPSQPGARTGLLTITAGSGYTPTYVNIAATAIPIITANNGSIDLGITPVGQPVTQFFKILQPFSTLTAAATGPFTVDLIEDTGFGPGTPPASAFTSTLTSTCHNCYLAVRFLPTAAGLQSGTLTLSSSAAGTPYALALTGTGTALSGLVLTPASQDFGTVPLHSTSGSILFTLTNLTGSPATLTTPSFTGDFAQSAIPTGGQTCAPGILAAGAACFLNVAFTPTALGTRIGTLTLGSAVSTLTGLATADPGLAINPLALTFTAAATPQTVTLTNTGSAALTIGTPSASTTQFPSSSTCTTLAPAASCIITVTFTPGAATLTDTLSIPVSGATYTVALNGTYTFASAGLQVTPSVANFGSSPIATETAARLYTVSNLSTKTLTLDLNIPRQFVLATNTCVTLAPSATCTFSLSFLPLTNGSIPGSINIVATPADGSASLSAIAYAEGYGSGAGSLTLTGGLISYGLFNFGQVASGQSASQVFTLTNGTASNLTVRRITSNPPFRASSTCGSTLLPAQNCTVTVTYTPSNQVATGTSSPASTTDTGTLTIESDAASSPDILNLTGMAGAATVSSPSNPTTIAAYTLSESSLSFPSTAVGNTSAPQTLTLTNTGTVSLSVLSLGFTADFTVSSTCASVVPGASCTLTSTSTPQTAGTHIASLEIASTASTDLEFVSLISIGTPSTLVISPSSLDFGSAILGTHSQQLVQVTNSGTAPITFLSITASGDYAPSGSCPAANSILAAGQSCTVQVTFTPTGTGTRPGTLSIATSASTLPRTVSLTGIGIQSQLVVSPTALAFGPLVVGASANLSLTLTNSGSAPITALTLRTTGDYAVTLPCPSTTLAVGATCTAQIIFTPAAAGARPGTLVITSSDPSSPLTVPLTGTGILAGSFTLTVDGGASSSVSVKSGAPATFHLTLTPTGSFAGSVALTCTPVAAAQYASCSLAPASLTLNGAAQTSIATINTITSANGNAMLERPHTGRLEKLLCLLIPGFLTLWRGRRSLRGRLSTRLLLLFLGATLLASGCGSEGGDFNLRYTPAGVYQYQVTAISTSGVQISQTVTLNLTVTPR